MEIKGTDLPPLKVSTPEIAELSKTLPIKTAVESWKTNQLLKAFVTETNPQQTRLNIQGVLAQTATPAKLELQVGQQLTVQVISKNAVPDLKLISFDKPAQQIVAENLRTFLPKQQPLTPLLAEFKTISKQPQLQQLLPGDFVQQVKKFIANLPEPAQLKNPGEIKQVFQRSGIFLEQNLTQASQTGKTNIVDTDLRSVLLRLAALLRTSLNQPSALSTPSLESSLAQSITSTLLKQTPQPQASVASRLADIANAEQLKLEIIKQIESSIARMHSLQLTTVKTDDTFNPLWAVEIPVRHQDSLDLFDIRIQEEEQGKDNDTTKHRWTLSLAFELEGLGAIHVRVSFFEEKISATFWVKEPGAHKIFSEHLQVLQQRLKNAGLEIERLNINEGEPNLNSTRSWQRILDEKA